MSVTPWFLVCARRFRQYRHAPRAYSSMLLPPPSFLPTVQTDHFLFSSLHTYISCLHFSGRSPLSGRQTSATEPHPLRPSHALRTRETSRTRQQHAACHASCAHSSHDSGVRPALQHVHQTRRACAHERHADIICQVGVAIMSGRSARHAYAATHHAATRRTHRHRARAPPWSEAWR